MNSLVLDFIRDSPNGSDIVRTFALIEVAERVIENGMQMYTEKAELIYNMFMPLGEMAPWFMEYTPLLFEFHCEEIIKRIGDGANKEEMQAGTIAECLITLSLCSLDAPLTMDGAVLFYSLFKKAFGELVDKGSNWGKMIAEIIRTEIHESYEGATRDLWNITRRKVSGARKVRIPTQAELDARRQEDLRLGNRLPWMKYQEDVKPMQMTMEVFDGVPSLSRR